MIAAGMIEAALARGEKVKVWNRTLDKARALRRLGAEVAETPAAAVAGASRVHVVLSDDSAVDAVLAQCGSALDGMVVVDHTTASPSGTKRRAAELEARGIAFVHAPVFMSPAMCKEARGLMLACGKQASFERVKDELAKMTGSVEYLGERADVAAANKLFGNAMILTITAGIADVFSMAKAAGISVPDAYRLFENFNPGMTLVYRGAEMAKGNFEPRFELSMARKDARLMLELAAEGNVELGVLPSVASWMDRLIERGHGGEDLGVLAIDALQR
jgi:3-hydroxyisobutyrate dehydrogenase-like beta-hydroxyacid dehydrogenase